MSLLFTDRKQLRSWLAENCRSSCGVWLVFGKSGGPQTVTAAEALEEALCFGWIDGQMQSAGGNTYIKYFSERRAKSKWSDKNKAIAESLIDSGLMTRFGMEKIEEAKENGQWDTVDPMTFGEAHIAELAVLLNGSALDKFNALPQSAKKTFVRAYFDAKTDAGRQKRLARITDALNDNLRGL